MAISNSIGTTLTIDAKVVGALKSISGVELSSETIDVTNLYTSGGFREFINGFKDGGEVTVSGYYDATDTGIGELYDSIGGAAQACIITFPTAVAKKWTFNGVVTKFATGFDVDGAITFDATIKVSGGAVLAPVSP